MDLFKNRAAQTMEIGRSCEPFDDENYLFEIKLDGERCLIYADDKGVDLINRRGNRMLAKIPELADSNTQITGRCILDGELVVVRDGKPDFEEIKRRSSTNSPQRIEMLQRQAPVTYVAFDILYRDGESLVNKPLAERLEILATVVRENARISLSRTVKGQGVALFQNAVQHGLEGVVGKRMDSLYHMGKRTGDWVKIKHTMDDEYVVCGYVLEAEFVASLILGQYGSAGRMLYKGRVTIARSSPDFASILGLPKQKKSPFAEKIPKDDARAQWVKPALVCTVQFLHRGPGGMMRHPVYKGLRNDKRPTAVKETSISANNTI